MSHSIAPFDRSEPAMRRRLRARVLRLVLLFSLVLALAVASPTGVRAASTLSAGQAFPSETIVNGQDVGTVTVEGATSATAPANSTSIAFAHTTGAGDGRLMLVGISWNCGSTDRTISSVTFGYGDTTLNL